MILSGKQYLVDWLGLSPAARAYMARVIELEQLFGRLEW